MLDFTAILRLSARTVIHFFARPNRMPPRVCVFHSGNPSNRPSIQERNARLTTSSQEYLSNNPALKRYRRSGLKCVNGVG